MKNLKLPLLILLFCILSFVLGFWFKDVYQSKSTKTEMAKIETVKNTEQITKKDSLANVHKTKTTERDYSKELKGKFILKNADYAGFDFVDDKLLTWTNEMFPMDPDSMRIKWISKDIFVGTFIKEKKDECPPRNWINKVEYFDGNKLILKDIWTGWGDSKDEVKTFYYTQYDD